MQTMWKGLSLAAFAVALALPANAQVKIGVTISTTGPAAVLGVPIANTIELIPQGDRRGETRSHRS